MNQSVTLVLEMSLRREDEHAYAELIGQITGLARGGGSELRYDFFWDEGREGHVFAVETHPDVASLLAHFERAMPLLEQAWALAPPVRTLVLGDLPPEVEAHLRQTGASVIPGWIRSEAG